MGTARSLKYRVHLSRRQNHNTKKMSHNLATSRSLSSLQYHASSSSLKKTTTTKKTFSNTNVIKRRSIVKTMIRSDLEPDNISVLVAGGSGVAMDVFRQLTAAGTWVTVLQRHEDNRKEIESVGGFLVKGDVFDPKALKLVEEYDAVVSTVGGTPADPKADSEGNIALIDACVAKGIKKFVLVTSIGTGDSKSAPPQNVYDALEPVLIEKEKAEEHLKNIAKEKGIDFVIVRPGGLKSEPRTNTAVLTENTNVCGAIHREDVAALTMMCVLKDKANGKVLSAVDKAQL